MTLSRFEIAGASVVGAAHRRTGRASQDAWAVHRGSECLVVLVADGCGSGARSEVGAALGVGLLGEAIRRRLDAGGSVDDPTMWRAAELDLLASLRVLAGAMGGCSRSLVADTFLFTVVGAALTAERAAVFAAGDGLFAVNGELTEIGPFPGNQPPYLGYGLIPGTPATSIELRAAIDTAAVDSLLLATDGALDWDPAAGELAEIAADDACFANPDGLRRRLARQSREVVRPDWEARVLERSGGRLADDTTVVAIRRRRCAST
jgi:hypothetical protein